MYGFNAEIAANVPMLTMLETPPKEVKQRYRLKYSGDSSSVSYDFLARDDEDARVEAFRFLKLRDNASEMSFRASGGKYIERISDGMKVYPKQHN